MSLSEADPFLREPPANAPEWNVTVSTGNTAVDSLSRVTEAMAFLMEAYEQDMAATDKVLQALLQELTQITQQAKETDAERLQVEQAHKHLQAMEAENTRLATPAQTVQKKML